MKKNLWPAFLFTLAIRFVGGAALGCGVCVFCMWRGILRSFSRNNTRWPLVLMIVCGVIAGFYAVFTIPRWQTPWYEGLSNDEENIS